MFSQIKLYALGGAALAVAALFGWLMWQLWAQSLALSASKEAVSQITSERDTLRDANANTARAIEDLARANKVDTAGLLGLQLAILDINKKLSAATAQRQTIAGTNPDVKTFLALPIPVALRGGQLPTPSSPTDQGNKN